MDHSGREDRKLSEVKAVLRRLQGLATEPESLGVPAADARPSRPRRIGAAASIIIAAVAVILVVAYALPGLRQPTTPTQDGTSMPVSEGTAGKDALAADPGGPSSVLQAAGVGRRAPADDPLKTKAGGWPQRLAPAKATAVRPALAAALALMTKGRVQAARQRLLAMAAVDRSPDVAWALARSYDPNSLGAIPAADARPDIEEAARWYRTWYAAAVNQGLVADSVSLERIIGSMQR